MNKPKLRIEAELTRLGFVKVEPDFWAWFQFRPERTITRLDVALGGAVTATYSKEDKGRYGWWLGRGHLTRHALHIDKPEDVKPALDLLCGAR